MGSARMVGGGGEDGWWGTRKDGRASEGGI